MAKAWEFLLWLVFTATVILILSPPYLIQTGHPVAAQLIYSLFKPFCHQNPQRSVGLSEIPFAVCARCLGIYAGLFVGATLYPVFSIRRGYAFPPLWVLIIFLAPLVLDGGTQLVGLRHSTNALRLATGALFGFILVFLLNPAIKDVCDKLK